MTEAGEGEVFIDETHQTPAGNRTPSLQRLPQLRKRDACRHGNIPKLVVPDPGRCCMCHHEPPGRGGFELASATSHVNARFRPL